MNSLVNYASESESDTEDIPSSSRVLEQPPIPVVQGIASSPPHTTAQENQPENKVHDTITGDNDSTNQGEVFVSAALKDLQNFAAAIDTNTVSSILADDGSEKSSAMEVDQEEPAATISPRKGVELSMEQQTIMDAFLKEIDALPLTSKDQSQPPPHSSSIYNSGTADHSDAKNKNLDTDEPPSVLDACWQQSQTVQSIYSRIHQLSLVSSPTLDPKVMESRLIEYAIRILDWEQGGLKSGYFLGEERAVAISKMHEESSRSKENAIEDDDESDDQDDEDDSDVTTVQLPAFGGVVGEMLEYMHEVEQSAAPPGWKIVWNAKDASYGFRHTASRNESTHDAEQNIDSAGGKD
ncbi:hypothetical protein BG011_008344 [Mortierella polycephala]|uniref:Uncharacterized protein n=1 Tax=Mortierella polycephala TaxID=41804 RepID=A0A9P6TX48_9FUNG|nr:hypothetical protein BG011_008344 [Mortierella polycephala]